MSGYKFEVEHAKQFASHVGIQYRIKGDELIFRKCPYCNATSNDQETCSINLTTGQYHCFRSSCGAKGNMLTLSRDFGFHLPEIDKWQAVPRGRFKRFVQKAEYKPADTMSEFLESRGISEAIAEKYKLCVRKDNPEVLVFPFTYKDEIVFVKYRDMKWTSDKTYNGKKANKEWCESNSKPILFGMEQCDASIDTLVITEGQMDSLALAEAGVPNPVSVPTGALGMSWVPHCWEFMQQFKHIVVFGDYENGKISLLEELSKRLPEKIKHIREEDYKDCKDANDLLRKYGKKHLLEAVSKAVPIPNERIIRVSDVEQVDPFEIEKLPTGYKTLDSKLKGGLPFGQITLISGSAGEGKSTFASQLLCEALDHHYCCFVYSGELTNYQFKSWLNMQLAGKRMMDYKTSSTSEIYHKVSDENLIAMDNWYYDRLFIQSDHWNGEPESIAKTVTDAICKNNARVILIDNLMTAVDLEEDNAEILNKQTNLTMKLAEIARNYNVLIILVAHKRKKIAGQSQGNDDVAGSSNIVNLASVHLSYEQGKDTEERSQNYRRLKIYKNRLFGYRETDGILLAYDDKSKRVYEVGHNDQRYKDYGWCKTENIQEAKDKEIDENTPYGEIDNR